MAGAVVITGAQGLIGRYLIADWLAADPNITVIGIGRSPRLDEHFTHFIQCGGSQVLAPLPGFLAEVLRSDRYRYVTLDVADTLSLTQLLAEANPDIIVHLAASLRADPPMQLVHTNVGTVASLFGAVSEAGLDSKRIVFGSSGSVYGHLPGRVPPFSEDAVCAPIDPYAATKLAGENLGRLLAEQYGVSALWGRIFNPVGPGQQERHLCGWLGRQFAAIANGSQKPVVSVGPLDTTRDFIDVRDTAAALRLIAIRGKSGTIYNIASGRETSGQEVFDLLLNLSRLAGTISVERLPGRRADVTRHYADVARLMALGYSPRFSLTESLAQVLEYYRESLVKNVTCSTD